MKKYILFDLDGTLTDPFMGITRSVQYSLKKFGIESELEALRDFIGPPLYDSYMQKFGFTREQAEQAVAYYRELYRDGSAMYDNRVYDGVPEMLTTLKNAGAELILATSKPIIFTEKIMSHFGLDVYFNAMFGCELNGVRVRKEEVIAYALEQHGMSASDCIMVGDRMHDIIGAHKNNMPCIGVLWGYGTRQEFIDNNADVIVETIPELTAFLV